MKKVCPRVTNHYYLSTGHNRDYYKYTSRHSDVVGGLNLGVPVNWGSELFQAEAGPETLTGCAAELGQ